MGKKFWDYAAPVLGSALGEQFLPGLGSRFGMDLSPTMGGALGGALGGGATHGLTGALEGGLGGALEGGALGKVGGMNGVFGSLFGSGQGTGGSTIMSGAPSAMPAMSAQSVPSFMGGGERITGDAGPAGAQGGLDMSSKGMDLSGGGASANQTGELNVGFQDPSAMGDHHGGMFSDMNPMLKKYLLPTLLMGGSIARGNQESGAMKHLESLAAGQADQSKLLNPLVQSEMGGNLPAGAQTYLDQAKESAMAQVRAKYAAMNMSGSTAEAQDLAGVETSAVAERFKIAEGLANQGLTALQSSNAGAAALYQALMQAQSQQGSDMGNALAEFGSMFVGPQ